MSNEIEKKQEYEIVRPYADILQKDDAFYILIDMPGVDKKDLNISIDKDTLIIEGKTSYPNFEKEKLWEQEFDNVKYVRKFTLADTVDKEKIKASLKNGVLKIYLPKVAELKPKKIKIEMEE